MQTNITALPARPQLPVVEIAAAVQALIDAGRAMGIAQLELIAVLDAATPDTDREELGLEDSFMEHPVDGPGCLVADHDSAAWVEWTAMRGAAKRGTNFTAGEEDTEDDDSDHGGDEAEPNFARVVGEGAGCRISDDDVEHDGCELEGR